MAVRSTLLWRALLLLIGLLLSGPLVAQPVNAQDGAQAGLVIVTGNGDAATYCVALAPDETITGSELIKRAGVKTVVEQSAMGGTICSLNGTGCNFPAQSCFCQCEGAPCVYWAYWRQDDAGLWQYAMAGASNTRVRAGTVEGWVWGEGTTDAALSPPALTLADICAAPTAEAPADAASSAAGAQGEALATVPSDAQAGAPAESAASAVPLSAPPAEPAQTAEPVQPAKSNNTRALAMLAALVVIPAAALLLLRRRKGNA